MFYVSSMQAGPAYAGQLSHRRCWPAPCAGDCAEAGRPCICHATVCLQTLPKPGNAQLQELLASLVRSKQRGLQVAGDWKQQGTGGRVQHHLLLVAWAVALAQSLQKRGKREAGGLEVTSDWKQHSSNGQVGKLDLAACGHVIVLVHRMCQELAAGS